ncbi:phosphotriesterase-related protein [Cimex lectularius]|uniref:Phosphotriesterase-related protein n=1 Tax=Cimex lectularius TaxID=79782 RepID=A0A8I6RSP2_CIMLE|nr:phosphotriesterase-related protein [Cimex lectularius]XP_014250852.1 phosphotriesterase-related protein [Cimex lectularius]XP_014250854.1 phosphotriesterase-related protein [Cimex lectularius]
MSGSLKDFVKTVKGNVPISELGLTLTHEHLSLDYEKFYLQPPAQLKLALDATIRLDTVGFIKQYPYSNYDNIKFYNVHSEILEEMKRYKKFGGGTIVENTSNGLKRDLELMKKVADTGVHVIAGTGYYVEHSQPSGDRRLSVEEMCDTIRKEMSFCGFIGEVGSSWPITEFERRSIQATGIMQDELKCSVSFHPGRDNYAPEEIMRIYTEAGGSAEKAIMSHVERTLSNVEQILEFSNLNCYCQFDLFGIECSFYQFNVKQDMPSDAQRIDYIKALIEEKKLEKILVSHDIHTKHRLSHYGGHGYSHLITNVFPQMKNKGMQDDQINQISIKNPSKWLSKS